MKITQEVLARKEAATSFEKYCQYVGGVTPAKHHRLICNKIQDVLDGKNKRLIICAPPGSAKSTYSSLLLPSFALGYKGKYKLIGGSHTQELAEDFSRKIRNQLGSQEYQNVFPNVQVSADARAASRWTTTAQGSYLASGVGAGKGACVTVPAGSTGAGATGRHGPHCGLQARYH